jgi:competence protein ComEA
MQKASKNRLIALLIIAALSFGGGALYGRNQQSRAQEAVNLLTIIEEGTAPLGDLPAEPENQLNEPPPQVAVHVKGAVEKPGLYELPAGSRVADALAMANLLPEANTDIINLASKLSDGTEVVVPFHEEGEDTDWQALVANIAASAASSAAPSNGNAGAAVSTAVSALININSANLTALQTLSGIGPVKAQAIIDYRVQQGPFAKIEDIKKVSGIGPATFDKIKDHITVD